MRGTALFFMALTCSAEVHTLTLREALERAMALNPEAVMARIDAQIAERNADIARGPFTPRVIVGSGLAYTSGMPMSVEGSTPSIVQGRVIQTLFNRPLSYQVAAARENARGAGIGAEAQREEVAYRTASLYLDAERMRREADLASKQVDSFERVAEVVRARVAEGRELDIETRRAALNSAQARQRAGALRGQADYAEATLAITLGFPAEDRVRPIGEAAVPRGAESETGAVETAIANNKDIRRLESAIRARGLEARSARAARLPQIDLVSQYALLSKINNYEEFFARFVRHNYQIGASFALPILPGGASKAEAARADLQAQRLRTELAATRDRVAVETRRRYQELRVNDEAREVAKLDLDVAREQLGVLLAQMEEGRASLRQVEEARAAEAARWSAFYAAETAVAQARLSLLRQTGEILAVLK